MRRFAYERPTSIADATRLLAESGADARVLAGGTDVVVGLRDHSLQPMVVVDVKRVAELDADVRRKDDAMTFGALTVMSAIEAHPDVLRDLPALAEAARVVGSVQIRNRATLVGNICNASPAADSAPPLLVYAAVVVAIGPAGARRIPMTEFITGPGETALGAGELVSSIEVPLPAAPYGAAYTRLVRRRGTDLASVTMCVGVDGAGAVRISYGSVGPRPFLATDDSGVLAAADATPAARAAVLDALLSQASPSLTSIRAGPDYRLAMLRVLAMRALESALARREGSAP